MKQLTAFFVALLVFNHVIAQPVASNCTANNNSAAIYSIDATMLAVERLNSINSNFKDSVEVPAVYTDSILKVLYAIHNMPSSALKDTLMNLFGFSNFNIFPGSYAYEVDSAHIHHPGSQVNGTANSAKRLTAYVTPTSAIAASWANGNYNNTSNSVVNYLINRYGLTISLSADYGTYKIYNIQCPKAYNTKALATQLFGTNVFYDVKPAFYAGDGNTIGLQFAADGITLDYKNGCGDCPAGCTYGTHWFFKVSFSDCVVNYLGATRQSLYLPNTTCIRGNAVMPTLFTNLKGYANGNVHTLEWTTTANNNLLQFIIEQSKDGINYSIIANIAAAQNNQYKWNVFAADNTTSFYRIKALAKDGYSTNSNLIKIAVSSKPLVQLYPNPVVNNAVHITYSKLEQGKYSIELFDQNVRAVFKQSVLINNTSGTTLVQLPAAIQKGNYLVVIKNSEAVVLKQFINIQ